MTEVKTHSTEETVALGREWGTVAGLGMVFALDGDLGAGKTQLARGIAQGCGYQGRVQSPSFGLINVYEGGGHVVHHLDLYRLETTDEIRGAGLEEYLNGETGVTIVEWASRWYGGDREMPRGLLRRVQLLSLNETDRVISYEDLGH